MKDQWLCINCDKKLKEKDINWLGDEGIPGVYAYCEPCAKWIKEPKISEEEEGDDET